MDELDVRSKLLEHYNNKNENQIKNIYSLIAIVFVIFFSDRLNYIPEQYEPNISEIVISFTPLFLYFIIRARYWACMTWGVMFVKPLPHDYSKKPNYKDNLFAQLNNACTYRIKTEEAKIFYFIPITLSAKMTFKYSCALLTFLLLIMFLNINFNVLFIISQVIFNDP